MNSELYSIRHATPEDASLIAEAERDIAKPPGRLAPRPEEIRDEDIQEKIISLSHKSRGIYLVAEKDGIIIGHALLEPHKLAVTAHVVSLTIAIHEGHQGMGIGKLLMHKLIEWARLKHEIEKIELQVRSSNGRAIGLYQRLGFMEEGRKTKRLKYGANDYQDDIYMALWVGD